MLIKDEFGSLASYFWRFARLEPLAADRSPPVSPASQELARDLKRRDRCQRERLPVLAKFTPATTTGAAAND